MLFWLVPNRSGAGLTLTQPVRPWSNFDKIPGPTYHVCGLGIEAATPLQSRSNGGCHMCRALIAVLVSFFAIPARAESQATIAELVARVRPAVVTIVTYDARFREKSQGSGFFVDAAGSLISSRHVFEGAHFAEVVTVNGARLPVANVIGEDEAADLIKVSVRLLGDSVVFVRLSPAVPPLGESVVVVGSPLGLEATVSNGIVSGLRQVPLIGRLIQITAPISRGSSGSPVVDSRGDVIGVAALQLIEGQNLNFAVPASRILDMPAPTATFNLREWSSPRPVQAMQPTAESPGLPRTQPELRGARIRMHASAIELRGLTGTVTSLRSRHGTTDLFTRAILTWAGHRN